MDKTSNIEEGTICGDFTVDIEWDEKLSDPSSKACIEFKKFVQNGILEIIDEQPEIKAKDNIEDIKIYFR